jgi:hypothetical protein
MSDGLPPVSVSHPFGTGTTCEVTIYTATLLDSAAHQRLARVSGLFVDAGNGGAFAAPTASPEQSRFEWADSPLSAADHFSFKLRAHSIDPRAFQFLRSMCSRLKLEGIEVARLTVKDLMQREGQMRPLPEPTDENETTAYPQLSEFIAFDVQSEQSGFSKARRFLVEMQDPLEASNLTALAEWIAPWYALLEAAAFALPVGLPYETECIRGAVTLFDEITSEISVDRFLATESAWDVLTNMIHSFARKVCPVSKVIID